MKQSKNEIAIDNYINGNISDFIKAVRSAHKKDITMMIVMLAEYLSVNRTYHHLTYSDNGYAEAVQIIHNIL